MPDDRPPAGPSAQGHPLVPGIYAVFPTADSHIAVVGVPSPLRPTFFAAIGRPELEEQMGKLLYFDDDKAELFPVLNEIFRTKTTAEWIEILRANGIRYAPVRDHAEIVADPDSWENGYLSECRWQARYVRVPVSFSDSDIVDPTPPPALGAHTFEVLDDPRLHRRGDRRAGRHRRDLSAAPVARPPSLSSRPNVKWVP